MLFNLSISPPGLPKQTIKYRCLKSVDINDFKKDIINYFSDFDCVTVENGIKSYNDKLNTILDKHAPLKSKEITVRADTPWYNSDLKREKQLRRTYERKYKKSKLEVDRQIYRDQRDKYNKLLDSTNKNY